ncbi:MAG: hypothetical protein WDN03_15470 [Rhizomicrobium sp.]
MGVAEYSPNLAFSEVNSARARLKQGLCHRSPELPTACSLPVVNVRPFALVDEVSNASPAELPERRMLGAVAEAAGDRNACALCGSGAASSSYGTFTGHSRGAAAEGVRCHGRGTAVGEEQVGDGPARPARRRR